MAEQPTGTVSLLFTDIEGSTRLLQWLGDRYGEVLAEHRRLLREAIAGHHGREVDNQGDAIFAAFPTAKDAVAAAAEAQRSLASHPWSEGVSLKVRMGIHTGEPATTDEGYVGIDLHRGARICAAGHGGQIVISQATRELVGEQLPAGVSLRDLGEHQLKDLAEPQRLFQVVLPDLATEFPPLRSLHPRRTNLPGQLSPLVGRERELEEVTTLLRQQTARLVTLTGPGGTGKTRLAVQAASALLDDFRDGVFFVSLAPLSDPLLLGPTIAQTLGVRESGGSSVEETLREELRDRELLVVLDNFEHLVSAAPAIANLLAGCPRLKATATSREALHVSGEHEYHVPPLPARDAVTLFEQRAGAARPGFAVTPANQAAVADICARLDGLPLAIELAAARVKLLPPDAMSTRLQRRLPLLVGGRRDLPSRQQTLRAAIDWSHDLLGPAEQQLFARLAVFSGGFTLEAAEAVCNPDGDLGVEVLDGVASLLDKSLLRSAGTDDAEPRVLLLQTIQEYAAERLQASGEAETIAARHAGHFLALAEQAEPQLWRAGQEVWFQRLDVEHDNLRTALAWSLARPDRETALRLAGALGAYWEGRGQIVEANRWLDAALAAGPASASSRARALMAKSRLVLLIEHDAARARPLLEEDLALLQQAGDTRLEVVALSHLAGAVRTLGDHERAEELFEESIALARREEDLWALALALNNRGDDLAERSDEPERARPLIEESLALRRALGEKRGLAVTLLNLGSVLQAEGDPEGAIPLFEESLALAREVGLVPHTAAALAALGLVAVYQHAPDRAAPLLQDGLRLAQDLRDRTTIAECLGGLAAVAAERSDLLQAARFLGAAERLHQATGSTPASMRFLYREHLPTWQQLGGEAFQSARAAGMQLPTEQAIAEALPM